MRTRAEILSELREGFERERETDFAQLRRTPSADVRQFLDYFRKLDRGRQDSLADALADQAFSGLFRDPNQPPLYQRNAAYKKYVDAMSDRSDWSFQSVRALKMSLAVARMESEPQELQPRRPRMALAKPVPKLGMPDHIKRWIESIKPVNSTGIRKQVKLTLSKVIGPMTVTHEGHDWRYDGVIQGRTLSVAVDYANKYYQLSYWVSVRNQRLGFWGSHFEGLMGLAFAHWDCLEQANLAESITLLGEHIAYCADFLHRLPDQPE